MPARASFLLGLACGGAIALRTASTRAVELTGGVAVGGVLAGVEPRLAVTPHVAISWQADSGFLFVARDLFSFLPAVNRGGVGVFNQVTAALGYGWETGSFSIGPAVAVYSMPACNPRFCGRVVGVAPGGHAQVSFYLLGPLGVSLTGNVSWLGGNSGVLPGDLAANFLAGPVVRWTMH